MKKFLRSLLAITLLLGNISFPGNGQRPQRQSLGHRKRTGIGGRQRCFDGPAAPH